MINRSLSLIAVVLVSSCLQKKSLDMQNDIRTFTNPLNINYRFALDSPSRREAADPTVVKFKGSYLLFASKSGGYWHSDDLLDWQFIETNEIPTEEYAPTAIAIGDTLFFLASSREKSTIYQSTDPMSGKWEVAVEELDEPVWDPAFFLDDDNRLYLYWGCSNQDPIYGVELDRENQFSFLGKPAELIHQRPEVLGWEVPGDHNQLINQRPWIEGPWMNKINGKYYLQYSGPGTEYESYADAVYVSDSALGPYELQPHNPFVYKPGGFGNGAGHGSTFTDDHGNMWHMGTITISQKHIFERRLAMSPVFIDEQGTLYTNTKYGDRPMVLPEKKIESIEEINPQWQLLSYDKEVEVSSVIDSLPVSNITDENIRTYWAAQSGSANEYVILDLGEKVTVRAIQINFAEHGSELMGINKTSFHRYQLDYSSDKKTWTNISSSQSAEQDLSHHYLQLPKAIKCRYIKVSNESVPSGNFAMSDLRVFGVGNGDKPEAVTTFNTLRNKADRRSVTLNWTPSSKATGYYINYGLDPNTLYQTYLVYKDTTVTINSLNAELDYEFMIEAFNENGISSPTSTGKN